MGRKLFCFVSVVAAVAGLAIGGNVGAEILGLWTFEEFEVGTGKVATGASKVADSSGNGRHLDNINDDPGAANDIVEGRDPGSKAIVFSGVNNDFLWFDDGGNANPFYFGYGDFTAEAIVKLDHGANTDSWNPKDLEEGGVVGVGDGGGGGWFLNTIARSASSTDSRAPGGLEYFACDEACDINNEPSHIFKSGLNAAPDGWYHMAMVRENGTMTSYADGVNVSADNWGGSPKEVNANLTGAYGSLHIGTRQASDFANPGFEENNEMKL